MMIIVNLEAMHLHLQWSYSFCNSWHFCLTFGEFEEVTSKATLMLLCSTAIGDFFNCQQHIRLPSLRKDKGDRKTVNDKLDADLGR